MQFKSYIELLILAALWGASFLFMRTASPEFGAISLILLRAGIAAIFLTLLMMLVARKDIKQIFTHWKPMLVLALSNTAIPFCLFAWATLSLEAGLTATINSTAPMFGALVAWLWLKENITVQTIVGLMIGFSGVFILLSEKLMSGTFVYLPILGALLASALYGFAASFSKLHAQGLKPLVVATGSQIFAATVLFIPGILTWPTVMPASSAWVDVVLLAVGSTGVAYLLYFRLLEREGISKALSVTYLIPLFAFVWGWWFLGEGVTTTVVIGAVTILFGVALTTGMVKFSLRKAAPGIT